MKKGEKKNSRRLIILGALILLFVLIGYVLKNQYIVLLNNSLSLFMQKIQVTFLVMISKLISGILEIYGVIFIALIFSGYLFLKKRRKESVISVLIIGLSSISVFILKNLYHIARPVNALISETDFSFPSGHSSIAVVLFGLFAIFYLKDSKRKKIPVILASALGILTVAFSRLYLNVHWLTDVIGGLILGGIWLLSTIIILDYYKKI